MILYVQYLALSWSHAELWTSGGRPIKVISLEKFHGVSVTPRYKQRVTTKSAKLKKQKNISDIGVPMNLLTAR